MPGFFLDLAATVTCPHGGTVQLGSGTVRVHIGGVPVVQAGEHHVVVGCPVQLGPTSSPCTRVIWGVPQGRALRVMVDGRAAMLVEPGAGICVDINGTSQGPAVIASSQAKVRGI